MELLKSLSVGFRASWAPHKTVFKHSQIYKLPVKNHFQEIILETVKTNLSIKINRICLKNLKLATFWLTFFIWPRCFATLIRKNLIHRNRLIMTGVMTFSHTCDISQISIVRKEYFYTTKIICHQFNNVITPNIIIFGPLQEEYDRTWKRKIDRKFNLQHNDTDVHSSSSTWKAKFNTV